MDAKSNTFSDRAPSIPCQLQQELIIKNYIPFKIKRQISSNSPRPWYDYLHAHSADSGPFLMEAPMLMKGHDALSFFN